MMHDQFATAIVLAGLTTGLFQYLKRKFPAFEALPSGAIRVWTSLAAVLAAMGVHLTADADWQAGTIVITLTGVFLYRILDFAWHWITQLVAQEIIYRTTVKE